MLVSQGQVLEAEPYKYSDEVNIPKYSVGTIKRYGGGCSTAWISSVVSTPFWHKYCGKYYKVIATAITTAHTIYFDENGLEKSWYFCVEPKEERKSNTFLASPFDRFC